MTVRSKLDLLRCVVLLSQRVEVWVLLDTLKGFPSKNTHSRYSYFEPVDQLLSLS